MKKKLLLHLILFFGYFNKAISQSCLAEGIIFSNQEQIDSFPINFPGCIQILGEVKIMEGMNEGINNLKGLSQITSIDRNLLVWNNPSLKSINGLEKLQFIGGNFSIFTNASLASLNGLENLDSIKGYLGILKNESLTSLNGIDHLTFLGSSLIIVNNDSLKDLRGLENLNKVDGYLSVKENDYLNSLDGLENLVSIEQWLDIYDNASLENLNSLKNLKTIGNYLNVKKNASLSSLHGLENVITIGGFMDVYDNPSLLNLDELENLIPKGEKIKKNRESLYNKLKVISLNDSLLYSGYLREVEDSVIIFSNLLSKKEAIYLTQNINIKDIKSIEYRTNKNAGKNILIGAITGLVLGGIIGFSLGDDKSYPSFFGSFLKFTAVQKAFLIGLPAGLIGVAIGAATSAVKITIPINGNQKSLKKCKADLLKYKINF